MDRIISLFLVIALASVAQSKSKLVERTDENGVEWVGPVRRCQKGNDAILDVCTRYAVKDLTPLVGDGIDEIGLRPLDPYIAKKFIYDKSLGPVNITILAKDIKISQLTKYNFIKFKLDSKKRTMHFNYEVPHVRLHAMYKLGGNVFFFPLSGAGPAQIEVFNLKVEGRIMYTKTVNEDNEEIAQVTKTTFDKFTIQDMNLSIRDLLPGYPLFSTAVHSFGKAYASQVFDIIKPEIAEACEDVITNELLNPSLVQFPHLTEYITDQ